MRNEAVYGAIDELRVNGGAGVVATVVAVRGSSPASLGSKMLIIDGGAAVGTVGGGCVDGQVWAAAREVLLRGVPQSLEVDLTDQEDDPNHGLICGGRVTLFLEPLLCNRVYVCGAGHVGEALCRLLRPLDFSAVVIDDRESFASAERFPHAQCVVENFDVALSGLEPEPDASIVIVTRGHRYDEVCLRWALGKKVRYVGLIGSRVKVTKLVARLRDEGVESERLRSIRAPIGLDIGSVTVEEIALSIAAELVAVRRLGSDRPRELAEGPRKPLASVCAVLRDKEGSGEGAEESHCMPEGSSIE